MIIYLGVGGSKIVHAFAKEHDCGWLMTPYNKRRELSGLRFCLDNGKFAVFLNEQEGEKRNRNPNWKPLVWDPDKFRKFYQSYPGYDFIVVPDRVCPPDPKDSLDLSESWVEEIPRPRYLAVQDGMDAAMVVAVIHKYDGIFVGGSIKWKNSTMPMWCDVAHLHGKKCHVGRIWGWESMIEAFFCGADSIDSTSASRHQDDLQIRLYKEALQTQTILTAKNRLEWHPAKVGEGCCR